MWFAKELSLYLFRERGSPLCFSDSGNENSSKLINGGLLPLHALINIHIDLYRTLKIALPTNSEFAPVRERWKPSGYRAAYLVPRIVVSLVFQERHRGKDRTCRHPTVYLVFYKGTNCDLLISQRAFIDNLKERGAFTPLCQ